MYCDYLIYSGILVVSTLPDIGALELPDFWDSVISLLQDICIPNRKAGSGWEKHGWLSYLLLPDLSSTTRPQEFFKAQ